MVARIGALSSWLRACVVILVLVFLAWMPSSCMTRTQGEKLSSDVFSLKAQLRQIQAQQVTSSGNFKGQTTKTQKNIAGLSSQIASWERQLQLLSGELDTVKKALGANDINAFVQQDRSAITELAQLSGELTQLKQSIESFWQQSIENLLADTVAPLNAQLSIISERLDALEAWQKKAQKSSSQSSGLSAQAPLRSLKEAREAHTKKEYKRLRDDIPDLIPKMTLESSKQELTFFYGESLFRLGDFPGAAEALDRYLKTSAMDPLLKRRAKLFLGHTFRLTGDQETAQIYYREVLAESPGTAQARVAGDELRKLGDTSESLSP